MLACAIAQIVGCASRRPVAGSPGGAIASDAHDSGTPSATPTAAASTTPAAGGGPGSGTPSAKPTATPSAAASPAAPAGSPTSAALAPQARPTDTATVLQKINKGYTRVEEGAFLPPKLFDKAIGYVWSWLPF